MKHTLRRGFSTMKEQGSLITVSKTIRYLSNKSRYYILKNLSHILLSRYVLDKDKLRSVATNFQELDIKLDDNISSEIIKGNININDSHSKRDVISEYDPMLLRQPYVCEIPDASLIGYYPVGITSNGSIIGDTIHSILDNNNRLSATLCRTPIRALGQHLVLNKRRSQSKSVDQINRGILLTSRWNHYGHWILEHALKLRFLEHYLGTETKCPTLILESSPPEWKRRYLVLLGYGDADTIKYNRKRLQIKSLVVPSYPEATNDSLKWLQDRVYENVDENVFNSTHSPSKVWLSRQNQNSRRITNSEEVFEIAKQYGFKICQPETMTVDQQIAYFSNIDVLGGPNGAAFTNMLYTSKDEVSVLELFGRRVHPGYYRMANILGFDHDYLLCKPNGKDIKVNIDKLEDIIKQIV